MTSPIPLATGHAHCPCRFKVDFTGSIAPSGKDQKAVRYNHTDWNSGKPRLILSRPFGAFPFSIPALTNTFYLVAFSPGCFQYKKAHVNYNKLLCLQGSR